MAVTAEEMWNRAGLTGDWDAWAFGDDPDALAKLVLDGVKTATCSALCLYEIEGEALPEAGEFNIILDARGQAVCVTQTTRVTVLPFCQVSARHAYLEGEGEKSLAAWRDSHRRFFTAELEAVGRAFREDLPLVCEEFRVVYPARDDN